MKSLRNLITGFALASGLSSVAYAQVPPRCEAALVPTVVVNKASERVKIAALRSIDQSNFEQRKTNADWGANLIIDAIPLQAFTSFSHFNEARNRYIERSEFILDRDQAIFFMSRSVPSEALTSFIECLRIEAGKEYGLHLVMGNSDNSMVRATVNWRPTPSALNVFPLSVDVEITEGAKTMKDTVRVRANQFAPITYRRNAAGERVVISVSGAGVKPPPSLQIAAVDRAPPLKPECRHVAHGVERFLKEYPEFRSVGDRPSGEHCQNWCTTWQSELLKGLPQGSTVVARQGCTHNSYLRWGTAIYSFQCILDVKADPIYNLRRSDFCS